MQNPFKKTPIEDAKNGDDTEEEKKIRPVIKSALDLQRLKLEKLMKNPNKPVIIPESPREKDYMQTVPSFVRNVMGSSAGAGSGEFHVYRHLRRKEYARQKSIQAKSLHEKLDEEYQMKLEKNRLEAEAKTAKKRAKRMKKKQRPKKPKVASKTDEDDKQNTTDEDDDEEDKDAEETNSTELKDHEEKLKTIMESQETNVEGEDKKTCDNSNDGTPKHDEVITANTSSIKETDVSSNIGEGKDGKQNASDSEKITEACDCITIDKVTGDTEAQLSKSTSQE